jgi:FkbM family methyltransferase
MPFISYAQNYEDVILWRALRDVENGFYVDVGAADPEEWSVTRAFYDRGWSGINVEPLDDYFDKLTKARPRDTNLKVAVGKESGVRTLHTIPETGLSTFDPEIALRQQAAGLQIQETVVPVLTLGKILEHCGGPIFHFLKIDVEGAEAEVVEGLDLERFRPWIIVIEATEPVSRVSTREKWEHGIASHRYSFAYFDGLNCFYVADEMPELKARLGVPPNVFDEFVCFGEWSSSQKAVTLEGELAGSREQEKALEAETANLRSALQAEQAQSAHLRSALQAKQAQTAHLRSALQAEQAQTAHLRSALQAGQAQVAKLEAELAVRLHYRRVLGGLREIGDRITGGGLRSLAKRIRGLRDRATGGGLRSLAKRTLTILVRWSMRSPALLAVGRTLLKPFPKVTTNLYQLATAPDASPTGSLSADGDKELATLPVSARPIYRRLQAVISESGGWNQNR